MTDEKKNRIDGSIATYLCDVVREVEELKRSLSYLESSVAAGMLESSYHNAGQVKKHARKLIDHLGMVQYCVNEQREDDSRMADKLKVVK